MGMKHALEEFIRDEVKRTGDTPMMIECIRQLERKHPEYKHSERLQSSGSLDKTKDQFARYLDHRKKKYQTIGPIDRHTTATKVIITIQCTLLTK